MTMRKCKFVILAIAVLLQVHLGASYLFAQGAALAEPFTRSMSALPLRIMNNADVKRNLHRGVGPSAPPSPSVDLISLLPSPLCLPKGVRRRATSLPQSRLLSGESI
jgi:hypothetical protein